MHLATTSSTSYFFHQISASGIKRSEIDMMKIFQDRDYKTKILDTQLKT
jgi:hypothetical protein